MWLRMSLSGESLGVLGAKVCVRVCVCLCVWFWLLPGAGGPVGSVLASLASACPGSLLPFPRLRLSSFGLRPAGPPVQALGLRCGIGPSHQESKGAAICWHTWVMAPWNQFSCIFQRQ